MSARRGRLREPQGWELAGDWLGMVFGCRRAKGLGCRMPERVCGISLVLAVGAAVFAAGAVLPQGLLGGLRAAAAAEARFTVGNYPVEARADNAVAAKDRALSEGQQAAM